MEVTLVNTTTSTGGSTNNSNNNNNFTSSSSTSNGKHICGSPFIIQVDPGISDIPLLSLSGYIYIFSPWIHIWNIRFHLFRFNQYFLIIIPTPAETYATNCTANGVGLSGTYISLPLLLDHSFLLSLWRFIVYLFICFLFYPTNCFEFYSSILFYSILFYSILFYSILFYSIG